MKVDAISVFGSRLDSSKISSRLSSPELITPKDEAKFNHFPRTTLLTWKPVPNAITYDVEIEACNDECFLVDFKRVISNTDYTFDFIGAGRGRWRVYSVNIDQLSSPPSQWSSFYYLQ
jgi:hypothetical protein